MSQFKLLHPVLLKEKAAKSYDLTALFVPGAGLEPVREYSH
jgi:hypothetical protein